MPETRPRHFLTGIAVAVCLWMWTLPAAAGWLQVDSDGSRSLIAAGRMKHISPEDPQWMAFDFRKGTVTFVNTARKTFAQGSIEAYCAMMNQFMAAMDAFEAAMGPEGEEAETVAVQVVAAGPGGRIAGFETMKYQVMADGELYEEVWLASDASLLEELTRARHFQTLLECTSASDDQVESSPVYRELMLKGWQLKSISHDFGEPEVDFEVARLEKTEIPDAEFQPPPGYRKISFEEMFAAE